jgi:hypothetical protein
MSLPPVEAAAAVRLEPSDAAVLATGLMDATVRLEEIPVGP